MSEIEQANGIEIPAEVVEAAARAINAATMPTTLTPGNPHDLARAALTAALDAWGATVETKPGGEGIERYHPSKSRIVTPWREVP